MSKSASLLSKSAEGATFLIILQIGSRALTFAVNQLLLRYLSPELLGISTQLEVYSISVLFFSREALRVAVQRQTDINDTISEEHGAISVPREQKLYNAIEPARKTQTVVNLAYISIISGVFLAPSIGWVYWKTRASVTVTPYFNEGLQLYGIAALLELLAEPCFMVVQQKSKYKIRAAAESIAAVLRCLVTCSSVIFATRRGLNQGVLPFALGQWSYGLSLLFVYYSKVRQIAAAGGFSLAPSEISASNDYLFSFLSRPLLNLGTTLFVQGVFKHLLTQGDVILISYLAPLQAQGIYALASNYGGLMARMIFQPIEESSRNYFGKLLSAIDGAPTKERVRLASQDLHNLLKFYSLLSVCAASVGPTIAPLLLNVVAGSRWTSSGAGDVLAKYCYYIPLLAMNGVTEAFVAAVANESELNGQSVWMLGFSAGFAGAAFIFLRVLHLGAEGLVWANVINMTLRIAWSWRFIDNYLQRSGSRLSVGRIMPQTMTIAAAVATTGALVQVRTTFTGGFGDLVKSCLISCCFAILLAVLERQYLMQCYRFIRIPTT